MRLILGIMLICWMFIIFWFSNQPATESSEISGTISYRLVEAAHMTEYAILGWIAFAFLGSCGIQGKMHYIAVLGFNFCYASTDEIHQLFIPGRSGQFKDVCIDTAGTAIGLLLLAILLKIGRRHCAKSAHTLQ